MEVKPRGVPWFFGWQPAWVTAVVAVLVILLAGSGTTAAASSSMPDEPLYQVKLATETVRLALTPSSLGKAELYVSYADKRVAEIIKMADKGKARQVERAAQRLDNQLVALAGLGSPVEDAVTTLGTEEPIMMAEEAPQVREAPRAAVEEAPLKAVAPRAPGPPEGAGQGRGGGQGNGQGNGVRGQEAQPGKQARLKGVLANRAAENTKALRAALNRVPESARPALIEAIEVAGIGYERVLESLD